MYIYYIEYLVKVTSFAHDEINICIKMLDLNYHFGFVPI